VTTASRMPLESGPRTTPYRAAVVTLSAVRSRAPNTANSSTSTTVRLNEGICCLGGIVRDPRRVTTFGNATVRVGRVKSNVQAGTGIY
jgi:hypothetical protein